MAEKNEKLKKKKKTTKAGEIEQGKLPAELQGEITSAGSLFGKFFARSGLALSAYNPDDLAQRKGLKIYRKMALDEQIKSALLAKKYAVLSTGWEIQLPEGIDDKDEEEAIEDEEEGLLPGQQQNPLSKQPPFPGLGDEGEEDEKQFDLLDNDEEQGDKVDPFKPPLEGGEEGGEEKKASPFEEHRDFVQFVFDEMEGSFDSKILDVLTALDFGFSVSEKMFGLIDYGPFEGKIGLKDLRTRPPDDFEFYTDDYGTLAEDGITQNGIRMPRIKFVIYSYRKTFGNLYGNSDLREAYRAWWSKDNMLKMMAIALERYGEPIGVVTHEGTLTAPQRAEIERFFKELQSRTGVILPKGVTLEFKNPPPRTAEAFVPAINLYDQHMRIAVLLPGLLGLSGEQATGSFARAVKEFDVFLWILGQLRRDLETLINEQIIKPLCDMNFEIEGGKYPKFKFKAVTEDDKRRQFELFITGLSTGALIKGPEDENKLRELIDWDPLPEGFEEQQRIEQAAQMGGLFPGGGGFPGQEQQPGGFPAFPGAGGEQEGDYLPSPDEEEEDEFFFDRNGERVYNRADADEDLAEFIRGLR